MAKTLHAEADLLHGPVLQNMLRFALPILAGTLLQQLYSMVDAVVVGSSSARRRWPRSAVRRSRSSICC